MDLNARFWGWVNGDWVKLTLRPGEVLTWFKHHITEEGYSSEAVTYEFNGALVLRETILDEQDCDGRLEKHYVQCCSITRLRDRTRTEREMSDPEFVRLGMTSSKLCSASENYRYRKAYAFAYTINYPEWKDVKIWQRDYNAERAGY